MTMAYVKKEPNTKCRFSGCTNGTDKYSIKLNEGQLNGPKWVYSCAYCKRNDAWKTHACSLEHSEAYQLEVLQARAANRIVDTKPVMSDMTDFEYQELMSKPIEQVEAETKQELSDMGYAEEVETLGISGTVDLINMELAEDDVTVNKNVNENVVVTKKNRRKRDEY